MAARFCKDRDNRVAGPFKGFADFIPKPHWTGRVELIPSMLDIPLRRKKPTTYFVNSMSDLFHEALPDEAIDRVFAVMAHCRQHTFQVLTKRAERLMEWATTPDRKQRVGRVFGEWPLPNVWLGVSVENRSTFAVWNRIDILRQTPAVVRFLSLEPLLGDLGTLNLDGIGWVIVGGESGPGARPMHPDWVRSIRDQCVAAGVPFFFKQWGAWGPARAETVEGCINHTNGRYHYVFDEKGPLMRIGKKAAGALLDGREWRQMPGDHA